MGALIFNGVSTLNKVLKEEQPLHPMLEGVVIQTPPSYEFPERDYEVYHIEGRSGDLTIDKGSYKNVKRSYLLGIVFQPLKTFSESAAEITSWLHSAKGYARLEDTYEPNVYRKALYRQGGSMTNIFDQASAIRIDFECKPQRYLKTGEITQSVLTKDIWVAINDNPTNFISLPELTIIGDSLTLEFASGDNPDVPDNYSKIIINYNGEIKIDSELQDAYNASQFLNSEIELTNGFPKLYSGKNWIKITGTTLTNCIIKPNWWTL